MKKIFISILAIIILAGFSSLALAQDLKIGYVDIFEVFNEYQKTKDYDEKLEGKKEKAEEALLKKKSTIEKMQSKLSVLREEERKRKEEALGEEVKEYREQERKAYTDIKKERDEKMKEIVEDIDEIVEDYAKKHQYTLIINENSILYGAKVMDITSEILKIANKQYKK